MIELYRKLRIIKTIMINSDPEFMIKFISPISYCSNIGLKGTVSLNSKTQPYISEA
jgi:hypothetical protein